MSYERDVNLEIEAGPDWRSGVPFCSESCARHDGKRCRILGFRPDGICEPAVSEMGRMLSGRKP